MTDPRYKRRAKLLTAYSCELKKGDRILLDLIDVPDEFAIELIRAARATGATALAEVRHTRVSRELLLGTNEKHASL
ncbi:MAG TPA: aminopeptidase, partial [Verrucomicrobiae bacterium]|nr:aminopeptidase [Verrucomicrobiae bacterium]